MSGGVVLSIGDIGAILVPLTALIVAIVLGIALHHQRLAQVTAADREQLRQSEEHYRLSLEMNPQIPWTSDADGLITEISPRWSEISGAPMDAALGSGWLTHLHPDDRAKTCAYWNAIVKRGDVNPADGRYRMQQCDGSYRWFRSRARPKYDAQGRVEKWYGSLEDIHDQVVAEAELRWAAHHDPLTQLPNRVLFAQRLEQALVESDGDGSCVGLVVLDIDHFKELNDTMGHAAGDALLREVARRVCHKLPPDASMARLGGDEFAIVMTGIHPNDAHVETLSKLLADSQGPFCFEGRSVEITLSAGAAIAPRDGTSSEDLLKNADLALYSAKAEARGTMRGFLPEMRDAVVREQRMLADARQALADGRIVPFYQPQVCLSTGKLIGFEALLRWHDDSLGLQRPKSIQAAFEDAGLAVQLTDRMLDLVLADMKAWRATGCNFGRIAINGSSADFTGGNFAERILAKLAAAGVPADLLELEVTETVLISQQARRVGQALRKLSKAGVTIALDDFGTGYASLSHLKQFPVDALKIDRSFLSRLTAAETEDSAIVGAVIDLAHNLGITTVAEGVETSVQAEYLIARGCNVVQGYLFGRPAAGRRVPHLVANWDPDSMLQRCLRLGWADALRLRPVGLL